MAFKMKGPSGFNKKGKYTVDTEHHSGGADRIKFTHAKSGKTTGYTTVDSGDDPDDYRAYKTKGGKTKEISKKKYKRQLKRKLGKQV